ncbi:hypothetical protein B566_EDAN009046 [Ephemera danica]|nr:hypothetical protein B566_EDAN009046 [Ephemera danica]
MKFVGHDSRIHVIDAESSAWQVLKDITESPLQEEAFYVLDVGDIVRKHKEWKLKLPRVEPHYAVKCNDSSTVLEVLASLGTGFDCASKVEMSKVLQLGVYPERIIFANPVKQASHIRHALTCGVDLMTFDNEVELHKTKALFPSARLVIRIRCEAAKAQCPLGMKFGVELSDAEKLLTVARDLELNVVGVSFHVGSGCSDPPVFSRAIAASRSLFDTAKALGFDFDLLDIGGGFPGNVGTSIDEIAKVINTSLDVHFPEGCGVRVIAEPGRFFVASAYTLATCVHSKRVVHQDDGDVSFMYYINDGVYGSFNCLLYDHAVATPVPVKGMDAGTLSLGSVWGPTCDGLDQVTGPLMLPEMQVGDWIAFPNMGAYTLPCASTFNGMPIPRVCAISKECTWLQLRGLHPITDDHFIAEGQMMMSPCKIMESEAWEIQGPPSPTDSSASSMSSGIDCPPLSDPFVNSFFDFEVAN